MVKQLNKPKITEKVLNYMDRRGVSKMHLAEVIGVTRPTFDSRISNHDWSQGEIDDLRKEGALKFIEGEKPREEE